MKGQKLYRFMVYFLMAVCVLGCVGAFLLMANSIIIPACIFIVIVLGVQVIVLWLLRKDGNAYRKKVRKAKEKNQLLLSVIPELFTEEYLDEDRISIDGDPDGNFGIEKGKIEKQLFLDRILPEHLEKYQMAYRQVSAGADIASANIRWKDVDGEYIWCEYHMTPVRTGDNKVKKIIGVLVNTDRKLKGELKNQQIFKSLKKIYSRVIFWNLDTDYYEYIQRDDLVYYNYNKSGDFQKINQNYIEEYVQEEDRARLQKVLSPEYLKEHLTETSPSVLIEYRKNMTHEEKEEWEVMEAVLLTLGDGQPTEVLLTVRDKKEAEIVAF
ncbi:MAG: PAS domain-containing protein [Lachnospiraceae bacterium]|nr:PAS domain-containing protein [Lachnospiraceae bacterium]